MRARDAKPGEWILGRGFQSARLKERRNPNRFDFDPISSNNPVGIANREGMGWTFNTCGLRRIGVEDNTCQPTWRPAPERPRPSAARLFVDFLLSKEAQTLMRERSRIPSRPDVPPDPPELTRGLKLIPTDLSLADQSNQLAKEFREIFKRQ